MFPCIMNGSLRAMVLTDAAPDALMVVYDRPGCKCVFEEAPCPFGEAPFKMLLRRKMEADDRACVQGIAQYPDSVRIRFTGPCGSGGLDDRQHFRLHAGQSGAGNINGDCIPTGYDCADADRIAAPGAVAFHSDHSVHKSKPWPEGRVQLHEHRHEEIPVDSGAEVPLHFAFAGNASEKILDCAGERRHPVGLEFREIDDRIGLMRRPGNFELLEPPAVFDLHRRIEFSELGSFFYHHIENAGSFGDFLQAPHPGAVAHQSRSASFMNKPDYCSDHLGMGRDRCLRRPRLEQIRFQQHPFPGPDKQADPAQEINSATYGGMYVVPIIIGTLNEGNFGCLWFFHTFLRGSLGYIYAGFFVRTAYGGINKSAFLLSMHCLHSRKHRSRIVPHLIADLKNKKGKAQSPCPS